MFRHLAVLPIKSAGRITGTTASKCFTSTLVTKIDQSVNELPLRDVARYTDKNMKWTAKQFLDYAESHANALIEHEFESGETIALWIPECAEKHVALVAAAKAGLKVVDIDVNITDVKEIRQALTLAQAKAIYFQPQIGDNDYLKLLRKSIPEFFDYDDSKGQFFHSKYFPSLKYFVSLGFDNEMGALNYRELFLRDPVTSYVANVQAKLVDDAPLYSKVVKGANGVELTGSVTHAQALESPSFSFAKKIVNKEYFETA